ncbi:hypothetical protein F385_467 [Pantoea agglomerans 299R]|nr:hypothetical protein F385_467 [Pantoea agglomerans 299R]
MTFFGQDAGQRESGRKEKQRDSSMKRMRARRASGSHEK